jgi:amino acid transporter
MKRTLKERHMAMIAIGGAIGTGLFVGSGSALSTGGPVGVWIAYCIMAFMVFSMMAALGEMAALFPVAGGFTHYAARFVDESLGFAVGVNYYYSYAVTIPTELVAAAIVVSYWDQHTNPAVYITVIFVLIYAVNFMGARAYGEAEFWFSAVKVATIIGLIILSLVLMCGGGPNHDPIGFRYWRNPGPFAQIALGTATGEGGYVPGRWGQFLAFWSVFVQAAFSFIGTEILATTLGEAENPRRTVPRAIRSVFWRLVIFYVFGIFFISVLVPYTDDRLLSPDANATASPFVIAINNAGIKALPSIVNAVILIAAWSAGNSDLYAASRTLYALAIQGQTPRGFGYDPFRYCLKNGLPIWCVVVTGLFGFLAYLNTGGPSAVEAFNWLYNLSAITGILTWWVILVAYLRFYYGLKKQGISRDDHPYKAPWQPWLSWFGLFFFTLVCLFCGFQIFLKGNFTANDLVASYISHIIFLFCWFGYKFWHKTKWIPLEEIDFMSGRRELDLMEEADKIKYAPTSRWKTILNFVF